jgi:intracellular septation protein
MMEKQLTLPDAVWSRLNLSWGVFFVLMGAINLFVAYRFSESTWVNFKLFGGIGLMVLFVLLQGMYLSRYVQGDGPAESEDGS